MTKNRSLTFIGLGLVLLFTILLVLKIVGDEESNAVLKARTTDEYSQLTQNIHYALIDEFGADLTTSIDPHSDTVYVAIHEDLLVGSPVSPESVVEELLAPYGEQFSMNLNLTDSSPNLLE